jgi:hypothetical protein
MATAGSRSASWRISATRPDGHEAIRYYKPVAEEPDDGWGIESETLGKLFVDA